MSELNRIKQAMVDGEHTDGDLEWCVDEIERLIVATKALAEGNIKRWADSCAMATELSQLQARISELEGDLDSAEEYICELRAEQEGEE